MESIQEGKDQERIQSSTAPDLRHIWESGKNIRNYHTQMSQEVSPFPADDQKAAGNKQHSIIKINVKQKEHRLSMVSKNH